MTRNTFHTIILVLLFAALPELLSAQPAAANKSRALVDSAMELGYIQGDIGAATTQLEEASRLDAADGEIQIALAKALITLGEIDLGHAAADKALKILPGSGGAYFVKAQALLLSGDAAGARYIAETTLERQDVVFGRGDRGGLSLTLAGIMMHAGDFDAAEHFLVSQRPALATLADEEPPRSVEEIGGGWHAIATLAHVYREQGETERADALLARLEPYNEAWIRDQNEGEIDAISQWNLAATGAGRIPAEAVLEYLEAAVDGGFLMSWRYNFEQHPTLWPVREQPRFKELIQRLDREMDRQRAQRVKLASPPPEQ